MAQARHRGPRRVEVAAEHERPAARPRQRGARGQHEVGAALLGRVRRARAGSPPSRRRAAHAVHHAPLGPQRQLALAVLGDRAAAHEDRVRAAAVGLEQVGVAGGDRAPQRRAAQLREVARCAPPRRSRAPSGRRPPRRHLLQQRDVPLPAGERAANSSSSGGPAGGCDAAVEEVPGEDVDRARTLPGRVHRRRPYTARACRATSSPGPSSSAAELAAPARPRARAQGASRSPRARSRARSVALLFEQPVDAHAHLVRGRHRRARRPPDGAAARRAAAHARRVGPRHRARALAPRRGDRPAHRARRRRSPSWPSTRPCPS